MALKINRMSDGAATERIVLVEDASLFDSDPHSRAAVAEAPVVATVAVAEPPSMNRAVLELVRLRHDERIVELFKQSTLEAINSLAPSTWEALVPVLREWASQKLLDRQAMAFSVAYHVMRFFPAVWSRPGLVGQVARFAAVCHDQVQAGNEFSHLGGLSYAEMRELDQFLASP